jgi:hypothetical protein
LITSPISVVDVDDGGRGIGSGGGTICGFGPVYKKTRQNIYMLKLIMSYH